MKRILLSLSLIISFLSISASTYNVRDYGAKGDGKALDHTAINKAIEACVAGGGGQAVRDTKAHLFQGSHTLTIRALDDHIVVDQITIL